MKTSIIFLSLCVSVSGWGLLPPPPFVALKKSKSLCKKKCLLPPPPPPLVAKKLICKKKKKKNNLKKKLILGGAAAAGLGLGGAVAVGGAAVALNQLNNGVVYEPEPGSLDGQVVLITGASSGLGLESAKRLAAAGATVVLTSRTKSKGEQAVEDVKTYLVDKVDDAKLYSLELDLDDLDQVKQFPESFKELGLGDISILMNNAGVMAIPQKELTKDGFERTFSSCHLGHFCLTAGMFPYLSRDGAKVINVASSAAYFAALGLDIDNLNGERSYSPWSSYGQSKLANILFTNELQKRADAAGLDWLTTVSLHPGVVDTDLSRYIVGEEKFQEMKNSDSFSIESLASRATSLFTLTPEQGANNQVFLAAGADGKLVKGAYYDDMKVKDKPGFMKDEDKAASLWEISEEYAGLTFDLTGLDKAVDGEVVEEAIEEAVIAVLEENIEEAAEAEIDDDASEESVSEATEEEDADEETDSSAEDESYEEKESESDDSSK